MGHMLPVHIKASVLATKYNVQTWTTGFTSTVHPVQNFSSSDTIIYVGSHYPPEDLLEKKTRNGAKIAYVSAHRHRDYVQDSSVVWIDPMWPWFEAGVTISGYDIPALAVSGVVNAVIVWELDRQSR